MPETPDARPFDAILVDAADGEDVVGGLRLVERAAFVLARAGAGRVLLVGPRPATPLRLPDVSIAWNEPASMWLGTAAPVVVVTSATTVVDPETIRTLAAATTASAVAARGPTILWSAGSSWLAARLRDAREADPLRDPPGDARAWTPPADAVLRTARDPESRRAAEDDLYRRLGRSGDGWFTRVVDRRLSRALTRLLLPTGVSPNQVTVASIAIGIVGGWCFARGTTLAATIGALLFLFSTIVDGCDGEIARLTFRESRFGARLDLFGDNVVHLFLFGGIAVGLYRRSGDPVVAVLGTVLLGGVVLAMATVYACVIRRTPSPTQQTFFEAFASREFAYLLVVLTLAGRLDWFLWLSAIGTYVFALGLVLLGRRSAA